MASKIPSTPKAIEAEQALLGSLIMDSTAWDKVSDKIDVNDFYDPNNKIIFKEIYNLSSNGQPIDIIVLEECLKSKDCLVKIGGLEYLGNLIKKVSTSAHIISYAEIIKEKSIMRELINISTRTIETIHQSKQGDVKDLLDKAESEIFAIAADSKTKDGLQKIGPIVNEYIDTVYNKKKNNGNH